MNKCTQLLPFMQDLFDDPATARKAAKIGEGIFKARSPRLSEIARELGGEMKPPTTSVSSGFWLHMTCSRCCRDYFGRRRPS